MALTKTPIELSSTPSIVDGGNATAITIDSSENVGIGISPSNTFSVGASGTVTTRYTSTDTSAFSLLQFENSGSIVLSADHGDSASSTEILFKTDGATERAKIDSNGDAQFQNRIFAGGGTGANTSVNADDLVLGLTNNSTERGITIASTAGGGIRWNDGADAGTLQYVHSTNRMQFYTAGALDVSIDSDGIKFGSDTAAANALDDYEEGTFSYDIIGITATTKNFAGIYTKIGDLVSIQGLVNISGKTGGTGNPYLPLPFVPDSTNIGTSYLGAIPQVNTISSDIVYFGLYGNSAQLYANNVSGGYIGNSSWGNGLIGLNFTYKVG